MAKRTGDFTPGRDFTPVCEPGTCLPHKLEAELAWGSMVGMVPGRVMRTRAEEVGGAPGPACDEHGNRVGNQLLHLSLAGSVANSHSRGNPGN